MKGEVVGGSGSVVGCGAGASATKLAGIRLAGMRTCQIRLGGALGMRTCQIRLGGAPDKAAIGSVTEVHQTGWETATEAEGAYPWHACCCMPGR